MVEDQILGFFYTLFWGNNLCLHKNTLERSRSRSRSRSRRWGVDPADAQLHMFVFVFKILLVSVFVFVFLFVFVFVFHLRDGLWILQMLSCICCPLRECCPTGNSAAAAEERRLPKENWRQKCRSAMMPHIADWGGRWRTKMLQVAMLVTSKLATPLPFECTYWHTLAFRCNIGDIMGKCRNHSCNPLDALQWSCFDTDISL